MFIHFLIRLHLTLFEGAKGPMIANVIPIITMTMANPITAAKNGATVSMR